MRLLPVPRIACCLFVSALLAPLQARGEGEAGAGLRDGAPPIVWDPAWPRFHAAEWGLTGAFAAIAVASQLPRGVAGISRGGVWFDDEVRSGLRLPERSQRLAAADASDVLLTALVAYPVLVDALVITAWRHRSPDAALQMSFITAEVLAITQGIQGLVSWLSRRERPYVGGCGSDEPGDGRDCTSDYQRYRSFFSGHTSTAFAAASVTCMHHVYLGLYGRPGDVAACTVGYAAAAATGLLRVAADKHYATDVLAGAAAGTLVGLGVPWLLHYRFDRKVGDRESASVRVLPQGLGAALFGTF